MAHTEGRGVQPGKDRRTRMRYNFAEPLAATFGLTAMRLTVFSEGGAQAEHKDRLNVGREADLTILLPQTDPVSVRAKVVWSRYGKSPRSNELVYQTGFSLNREMFPLAAKMVDFLVKIRRLQFDGDSLARREEAEARKRAQQVQVSQQRTLVSEFESENFRLVQSARVYLRNNPMENAKWLSRVRFSEIRKNATENIPDEVVAIWEFLERKVDIRTIKLVCQVD